MFIGKCSSLNLVNIKVFGVKNIFQVIVLVIVNFHYQRQYCCPERKSWLWKRWGLYLLVFQKETFTATRNTVPGIIWALDMFLVNLIMSITFHMNPRLTNTTLNCRVYIIDVNMAIFAGVNYIINIYKNAY